nr:MAG TPA: 40S ribosomal protein SA [Caudoviricetes sp.]
MSTSKFTATTFLLRCSIAAFAYPGGRGSFCPSCLLYAPGTRHCYWFRFVQQS